MGWLLELSAVGEGVFELVLRRVDFQQHPFMETLPTSWGGSSGSKLA